MNEISTRLDLPLSKQKRIPVFLYRNQADFKKGAGGMTDLVESSVWHQQKDKSSLMHLGFLPLPNKLQVMRSLMHCSFSFMGIVLQPCLYGSTKARQNILLMIGKLLTMVLADAISKGNLFSLGRFPIISQMMTEKVWLMHRAHQR